MAQNVPITQNLKYSSQQENDNIISHSFLTEYQRSVQKNQLTLKNAMHFKMKK